MSKKLFAIWLFAICIVFASNGCIFNGGDGNKPPDAPSITCPIEAKVDEKVVVTVCSIDPDGNKIAYKTRFGDGTDSEWTEYFKSGQSVAFTHKYTEPGDYQVKAIASDREAIGTWSEDRWIKIKTDLPPPRLISVLGTCLPGCEGMWKELEGTDTYGNRFDWPNHEELERLGLKVFVNIRADSGELTEELIRERVLEYKDRPVCGGWWSDQLGHEPDICNQSLEKRIWFYDTVRKYDSGPDAIQNRPVMEMFNCTEWDDFPEDVMKRFRLRSDAYSAQVRQQIEDIIRAGRYLGWKHNFNEKTIDVLMIDLYAFADNDEDMAREIERLFRKFIIPYNKTKQLVPQINAYMYRPGSIWCAYNTWKRLLALPEYDNPYKGMPFGLAYYCDLSIRANEDMQREIKEVNIEIAKGRM